jgi:hypothetical protein
VAARRGVTIILVKHFNKGVTAKAVHKVSGSAGYVNAVRAAYVIVPSADDPELKLFLPLKFNLGPKPGGLGYRMQGLPASDQQTILAPYTDLGEADRERLGEQLFRLEWAGEVDIDADTAVGDFARRERGPGRVEAAADWVKGFLKDYAYPSEEIKAAGVAAGFTFNNVRDAKARLKAEGLHSSNQGRFQGVWWCGFGEHRAWKLRPERPTGHTGQTGHNGESGAHCVQSVRCVRSGESDGWTDPDEAEALARDPFRSREPGGEG